MSANTLIHASYEPFSSQSAEELSIALISPNEKRRALAAESACGICEFSSYLANPADQARLSQLHYDVIMVDIDGDIENALKLVEKFSSDSATRVLVYSSDRSPEKLARCMHAGARDFLAFPFEATAVTAALTRLSSPRAASCIRKEQSEQRKFSPHRESMWRSMLDHSSVSRSQA